MFVKFTIEKAPIDYLALWEIFIAFIIIVTFLVGLALQLVSPIPNILGKILHCLFFIPKDNYVLYHMTTC